MINAAYDINRFIIDEISVAAEKGHSSYTTPVIPEGVFKHVLTNLKNTFKDQGLNVTLAKSNNKLLITWSDL